MTRRIPKRQRVRRKRVYAVLSALLLLSLALLLVLEQRVPDGERPAAVPPAEQVAGPEVRPRPAAEKPPEPEPPASVPPAARVAIVIDDVGYHGDLDALATGLPFPLTFAVLPGLSSSASSAARLRSAGGEIMLHLPMEPENYPENDPGPGALFTFMTHEEIRRTLREDLSLVPGVSGVNNHMGSRFTVREDLLKVVFEELRRHDLYFIDSRTTTATAALRVARRHGVPAGRRSVFLDNEEDAGAITARLDQLFRVAREDRIAIGIGHYRESTLLVLATEVPRLRRRYPDVNLVYASDIVN